MSAPRWNVEIVHPVTGRPKVWATYDSRELAEAEAAKLRAHKMFAQVRRLDDPDPEAGAGKSLAVWLFCLGARTLAETIRLFDQHPEWREA